MLNRIFIDSSFIVAFINERDADHEKSVQLNQLLEGQPLLTTDAVLLEVGNALSRLNRKSAVEIIEYALSSVEVEVVHLTPELFRGALELYKSRPDKTWGMVDCLSFITMRNAGVTTALTADKHFIQAGFQILMGESDR
jgi:predicted nucleic acid-binding protein